MEETNREKFIRLAEKRVGNTLNSIRLLGNLSNKSNYTYSDEDVDKIFSAIAKELKDCKKKFNQYSKDKKVNFKLTK
jgi:hypothetical protein